MSLGITITTPEGIVIAADSRQSYRNHKGMSRIGSDSASKIFQLGGKKGLVIAGVAFLAENGAFKNVSKFIDDFKRSHDIDKMTVSEASSELSKFFYERRNIPQQLAEIKKRIEAELVAQGASSVVSTLESDCVMVQYKDRSGADKTTRVAPEPLQFLVSGYNEGDGTQVGAVNIPGPTQIVRDSQVRGNDSGANWIGQTDVVTRIVRGFDPRMLQVVPSIKQVANAVTEPVFLAQLNSLQYSINWGTMTLQDAIDFSVLAIQTTSAIQRFSDGIDGDPGDMPGVGGPVDVAIITGGKGFFWVNKKELLVNGNRTNL